VASPDDHVGGSSFCKWWGGFGGGWAESRRIRWDPLPFKKVQLIGSNVGRLKQKRNKGFRRLLVRCGLDEGRVAIQFHNGGGGRFVLFISRLKCREEQHEIVSHGKQRTHPTRCR